MAMKACTKHCF